MSTTNKDTQQGFVNVIKTITENNFHNEKFLNQYTIFHEEHVQHVTDIKVILLIILILILIGLFTTAMVVLYKCLKKWCNAKTERNYIKRREASLRKSDAADKAAKDNKITRIV